jgi:dTDP-4-dehydrorhamnose reductase
MAKADSTQLTVLQEIDEELRKNIKTLTALIAMARQEGDIENTQELMRAAEHYANDLHLNYLRLNDWAECEAQEEAKQ